MPKGTETITVVRKPRADRLKPTPSEEQRFDITGCIIWPRVAQEQDGGWVQISGLNVFAPPGADVVAEDSVIARGERYSVKGEPGDYRKTETKRKGLMITLEKVS